LENDLLQENKIRWAAAIAAIVMCADALAQDDLPPPLPPDEALQADDIPDGVRLLSVARALRTEKGCVIAAPTYRAIVGLGNGFEAAQHELGECLLSISGQTPADTSLLHEEGAFWLKRAAYAGNARAQRALAMNSAAPNSAIFNPKEALQWCLVYERNAEAELYGYKSLPPTLVAGLRADLDAGSIAEAETFANEFVAIRLPEFERPKPQKAGNRGDRRQGQPPNGRRRPRQ
jgi:hypothetical protein